VKSLDLIGNLQTYCAQMFCARSFLYADIYAEASPLYKIFVLVFSCMAL